MKTIVLMAGGYGARLRPLTYKAPKPLLKLNGKCLIDYMLDNAISSGFEQCFICVNYKSEDIEKHVGSNYKGMKVSYTHENEPLGTAGALNLIKFECSDFILANADLIAEVDLANMLTTHKEEGNFITVGITFINHAVPYGVANYEKNGKIKSFTEKPATFYGVNSGIYAINTCITDYIDGKADMVTIINQAIKQKRSIGKYLDIQDWRDVGRNEDLAELINQNKDKL